MKMICNSCGAEIEDTMPKCPYCDTLIAAGAEAEYMEKLYDIHEDLEELDDIPLEVVKTEVKTQGRKVGKIIVCVACALVVLMGIFLWQERKYDRDLTADYIWGEEHFPVMTELYESGEYEELEKLFDEAMEEDRPVWNWEYYDEFCEKMEERQ